MNPFGEKMTESSVKYLEMRNISKSFIGVKALENVNIELAQGEILGICGENGAGKSTLMKILSGSYSAREYEGQIFINGKHVEFQNTHDARSYGIEMIYQEISLHPDLSIGENIMLGNLPTSRTGRVHWGQVYSTAYEILCRMNLNLDVKTPVRRLSTSQQQLITIARAIARQPKILVLDEPTSAITDKEVENLFEIIASLRSQNLSFIYISHKLEEVFEISDRVSVLRDGRLISTYQHDHFMKDRIIEDMVGRKIDNLYPRKKNDIGEEALRVENLTIPHPLTKQKKVLENISFSVRKGETLGLAGLVGSGRSELLNALFGVLTEGVTGKIYINGEEVSVDCPGTAKQNGLGFLTEDRRKSGFIGTMSIVKNVTIASLSQVTKLGVIRSNKETSIGEKFRDQLSIKSPSIHTNILNLSGGNQQKVVLAKWLSTRPAVLFLDEPTRGIDVGSKADFYNLMNALSKEGVAIVLVSSDMPELLAMSDRIIVLSNGKVAAEFVGGGEVSQIDIMTAIANAYQKNIPCDPER